MSGDEPGDEVFDGLHPSRRHFIKFVVAGAFAAPLVLSGGEASAEAGGPYRGELVYPPYYESEGSPWAFDGSEWTFARDKYVSETPIVCTNGWYPHYSSESSNAWACEYLGLQIISSSLTGATRGVRYGPVTLQVAGAGVSTGGYTTKFKWEAFELPKGMHLSATGVLSGTPSIHMAAGSYSVVVAVTETVTTVTATEKSKTKTTTQATIPLAIA